MPEQVDYAQPLHPQEAADRHLPDYWRPRRSFWTWWPVIVAVIVAVLVVAGILFIALASLHP